MTVETGVLERYSEGADKVQPDLCCPVDYDQGLLQLLPNEIIEKDYGCGDPSCYVKKDDVVLDLGSGSGKICYMAAQLVGANGKVIGVDMNDDMLGLARKYQAEMSDKLGSGRVEFVKGQIQDLALDLNAMNDYLKENPVHNAEDNIALRSWQAKQRTNTPLIKDNSIDLVVSNCVLNLVTDNDKAQMIQEIFRVTKPGGRVAISDIISDEYVPDHLKQDPHLWSGCISGALQEHEFMQAFIQAGFVAVTYDKWENQPWQVVEGIEFRSATITAVKPTGTDCIDKGHAVIYKGPFSEVYDDEGHVFFRGQRMAVCERIFKLLTQETYADNFVGIAPEEQWEGKAWCCAREAIRPVADTKNKIHQDSSNSGTSCC